METIEEIIFNLVGIQLFTDTKNEVVLKEQVINNSVNFLSPSLASVADILVNNSISLDNLVSFSQKNNISLVNVNKDTKKVVFDKNLIKDLSIFKNIQSKRLKFANGVISMVNESFSYMLQENGFYILQENGYKIIL
jgi:hypothetical protein